MKNIRRYLGLTLLMFAVVAMSSCIKENLSETNKSESATVTLRVNESRSDLTSPAEDNEGIKTLRVIVVDKSTNLVEFNFKQDYRDEANLLTQKTITFMGMTTGEKDFYVVANEESIGWDGSTLTVGENPESGFLTKVLENVRNYFPKARRDIGTDGLPITGYLNTTIQEGVKEQTITINAYHAVAKISMSFINNTGFNILIDRLLLGQFIADKTFLFGQNGTVPDGTVYYTHSFERQGEGATIYPGDYESVEHNKHLLEFYVCETAADPQTYTVAMESTASGISINEPKQFLSTSDIQRNNWIQVIATINRSSVGVTISFEWEVQPWGTEEIDVPSFD